MWIALFWLHWLKLIVLVLFYFRGLALIFAFHCISFWGLLGTRWCSGKESTWQLRKHGFNPRVGKMPWSRKWQPAPVFLPGKSHGQRSLAGYSPWGQKELDVTEHTHILLAVKDPHSYTPPSPGKSELLGMRPKYSFLKTLQSLPTYSESKEKMVITQSCLTLWNPMDCSAPGSSVHGILQAWIRSW